MGQHKHKKPNGMMSSESRAAAEGMHSHDGLSSMPDTPNHIHVEVATGERSGPKIPRVPGADKQRI